MPILSILALALQSKQPTVAFRLHTADAVVGKGLSGTLFLTLPEGTHGYQNPPADEFENPIRLRVSGKGFKLYGVRYPRGKEFKVAGAEKVSKVYEGVIEVPFYLVPTAPGSRTVTFEVDYQLCTEGSCYPPGTLKTVFPVKPFIIAPAPKKGKA